MADRYYSLKNCSVSFAGQADLTAWRNADAKLTAAECEPTDILLAGGYFLPYDQTIRVGALGGTKRKRVTTTRYPGTWRSHHCFQTAQFVYWVMCTSADTDNTPVGYNTHAITEKTTQTPLNFAMHVEHELTSEDRRHDLLGFIPTELTITCLQDGRAYQELRGVFAKHIAADELTPETERPIATTGSIWKNWKHAVTGTLGGAAQTALKYNSNELEIDITAIAHHIRRNYLLGVPDASGYYSVAVLNDLEYTVDITCKPRGSDLFTILNTAKESYAGDLDLDFYYTADATNDKIRFVYDKMYAVPFESRIPNYDEMFETYTFTLEELDDTSSLAVTGIDSLLETQYTNP